MWLLLHRIRPIEHLLHLGALVFWVGGGRGLTQFKTMGGLVIACRIKCNNCIVRSRWLLSHGRFGTPSPSSQAWAIEGPGSLETDSVLRRELRCRCFLFRGSELTVGLDLASPLR